MLGMNRGFARCRREIRKQRLREAIGCGHAFGVPLHPRDPVGIAGPFNRFDHVIGRVRHDAEIFPRLEHRLMMRAIHLNFV